MDAYRAALLGETASSEIDRDQLELFAYFYFIRTGIPWKLTMRAYDDHNFGGFTISSLEDLEKGRDPYLDHLCNCILDPDNTVTEAWPSETTSSSEPALSRQVSTETTASRA